MTPIDHPERISRVLHEVGGGTLAVDDLTDLRWLTGFDTSNGWAVLRGGELFVGTDGRYGDKAAAETAGTGATLIVEQQSEVLRERRAQLVGDAAADDLIRVLRRVKDPAEVERIEEAARIADAALAEVEPMLHGMTELDVRAELEYRMIRLGADDRSYPTIVATGPDHGARPHHGATRREIVEGDTVIIDVGALVDGYHSDMTRSWVIGEATSEQRGTYDLVAAAQRAGLDATFAGGSSRAVDAACRDVFEAAGRLHEYVHGTGHGVGLDIHELPFHNRTSDVTLEAGMVVTIEPGLYRGGFGGFRIEDLVLVTDAGHRVLTHSPKREL
ncbi:MAG: Xaa-Pro peptidase family protein [Ilumatobacter sp.]|uniref:M24 family metallopeptidase n=3 Tax=Ilumatobacter sp. TaxID=1967498 RepID=UPI0032974170